MLCRLAYRLAIWSAPVCFVVSVVFRLNERPIMQAAASHPSRLAAANKPPQHHQLAHAHHHQSGIPAAAVLPTHRPPVTSLACAPVRSVGLLHAGCASHSRSRVEEGNSQQLQPMTQWLPTLGLVLGGKAASMGCNQRTETCAATKVGFSAGGKHSSCTRLPATTVGSAAPPAQLRCVTCHPSLLLLTPLAFGLPRIATVHAAFFSAGRL